MDLSVRESILSKLDVNCGKHSTLL